ncbi:MAG TPA: hypothetical protein VGN95_09240 [Pyrinomonadaceae bacterium]|nr:hypothetical protein [Pyrinomonadaceae bacterium]
MRDERSDAAARRRGEIRTADPAGLFFALRRCVAHSPRLSSSLAFIFGLH